MSTARGAPGKTSHVRPRIPDLTPDKIEELAERHLAELTEAERTAPQAAPHTSWPRTKRAFRSVRTGAVWALEMLIRPWKYVWDPRQPLGRVWNHLRMLTPLQTFNGWRMALLIFAAGMGAATYAPTLGKVWFIPESVFTEEWFVDTTKGLFGIAVVGLLASLWSDLFRNPWLCYRIRRVIKKTPRCILDENLGSRPVKVVPHDDPIEIALRADICDEVLAGVLTRGLFMRDKKDVQILVGEPGAGKTTALIMLAQVLARIGILPVLLPLRSNEGQKEKIKLAAKAHDQFVEQVDRFVRSKDEAEKLWRWLYKRRRVAILTDDIDQIGADGERGAIMRQTLEDAMTLDLPVLVTARPAGLPAGMAASAISLTPLESDAALSSVVKGARKDPALRASHAVPSRQLEDWIREGELTEVPFYLELLAGLAATGNCPKLPEMDQLATAAQRAGHYRRMPDGHYNWNPLWVRFLLLERFYAEAAAGRVRRWLGIEAGERRSTLVALEGAALGTLVATGMKARAAQKFRGQPSMQERVRPLREEIIDFLSLDDRKLGLRERQTHEVISRRTAVSAHEAADTGERLRILERDYQGKLQFRHRIMQAYLAGSRLAVILFERAKNDTLESEGDIEDPTPGADRPLDEHKLDETPWVRWLLDPHRPEKLTADMTLVFAAMCANVENEAAVNGRGSAPETQDAKLWMSVAEYVVKRLVDSAMKSLAADHGDGEIVGATVTVEERSAGVAAALGVAVVGEGVGRDGGSVDPSGKIDPRQVRDPDLRTDPDDALTKLTAAAEAAHAIGYTLGGAEELEERATAAASAHSRRQEIRREEQREKQLNAILKGVEEARFSTRWTKLRAIKAVAELGTAVRASDRSGEIASLPAWQQVWRFARDRDYKVRQAAGEAICDNAYDAYRALKEEIRKVILRAAARSAFGMSLHVGEQEDEGSDGLTSRGAWALAMQVSSEAQPTETTILAGSLPAAGDGSEREDDISRIGVEAWREDESLALEALGVVLPAIVSGLREDPEVHALETWQGREGPPNLDAERPSRGKHHRDEMSDVDYEHYGEVVREAYGWLRQLVALAFQGYQHPLEDALASGFKADAMRHAHEHGAPGGANAYAGPGWVASNRRIVLDVCARQAGSWYARLALTQAIALYTIAGAKKQEAYDILARQAHRGRERHPFTQRGARLARAAIRRSRLPLSRWHRWIWDDEAELAGRRHARLNRPTSQLAADVTLLLDLKEGSPQDYQEPFGSMRELPYCLSASRDRQEILGKGCPESCGWNLCPYKQAAPDEPDAQRGISRTFCREQQRYARHHQPKWQTHIPRRKLRSFWEEMERRART